jgi:phosphoglycolate phosphatase-like HAD superfamily hydrolase
VKARISVLITDLDNTLFDWVNIWHRSFNAMLEHLVAITGVPQAELESDFKKVFTRHGTSEYAFAIEELSALRAKYDVGDLKKLCEPAIQAFRVERAAAMRTYPGVVETLEELKDRGCLLVGYTESMAFYSNYRLRKLGLDRILDYVYSPADHELPTDLTREQIRLYPQEHYQLRRTITRNTPKGERKPNKQVLLDIIRDVGAIPGEVAYVGDSLIKDITMAQQAGVADVWAKYGVANDRREYELLRRVTHWPKDLVEQEAQTGESHVQPSYVLRGSLEEIKGLFEFCRFDGQSEEKVKIGIDLWKKTVDVQQHFNDLELRIRNNAVTVLVAILGAMAFALKEQFEVTVFGSRFALAGALMVPALVGWLAFWFMDRLWYHHLLMGAVNHGAFIEKRYGRLIPEIRLTKAIGDASPIHIWRFQIHSKKKMDIFYGSIALFLIAIFFLLHASHSKSTPPPPLPPRQASVSSNSAA